MRLRNRENPSTFLPQRHAHVGGEGIYVGSGEFIVEHGRYPAGTWIRSPHLSVHNSWVGWQTAPWVKTGHLVSDTR